MRSARRGQRALRTMCALVQAIPVFRASDQDVPCTLRATSAVLERDWRGIGEGWQSEGGRSPCPPSLIESHPSTATDCWRANSGSRCSDTCTQAAIIREVGHAASGLFPEPGHQRPSAAWSRLAYLSGCGTVPPMKDDETISLLPPRSERVRMRLSSEPCAGHSKLGRWPHT